jgi:cytochrome b561
MIFNSTTTWGWPAKALHWIGAAMILVLLAHGWWMTHMTARPERLANYAWHSALGYDLLALTVLRIVAMDQPSAGSTR